MNVTQAVAYELTRLEHVATADITTDQRSLALEYVIEVFHDIWYFKDWMFRRRTGQITVAADGTSVALPSDWSDFGSFGSAFRNSDHYELSCNIDEQELRAMQTAGVPYGPPQWYRWYDQDSSSPYQTLFQTTKVAESTVIDLTYNAAPPTLDETTNVNELNRIPVPFHETVIKSGLRAIAAYGHGDARKRDFAMDPQYVAAKMRMAAVLMRNPQSAMPPNFFDR